MRRAAIEKSEYLCDEYRILGKIGEGTYGIVYKVESGAPKSSSHQHHHHQHQRPPNPPPTLFAVKYVKSHKDQLKNDVVLSLATLREIKLLRELNHPNIVHLYDVHINPKEKCLALVFDYAHHDLRDIIVQSRNKPLSDYTKRSLMYQILKGMKYMHDSWVLHRDMKPQNILVVGEGRNRGQVKIADFGLARLYNQPIKVLSEVESVVVTLWYRAPELLFGAKHYTKAIDIWAVGCIFAEIVNTVELFCGKEVMENNAPFQRDQCDKIFKVLGMPTKETWEGLDYFPEYNNICAMARDRKYPSTKNAELRKEIKVGHGRNADALFDLLSRMLEYNPDKRITAAEALEHEYFAHMDQKTSDYAFDEPGKEPLSFQVQKVHPVADEKLPKGILRPRPAAETTSPTSGKRKKHRPMHSK